MTDGRARLRHAFITLALFAAAWSAILVLTSGIAFSLGPLHVSSRNARNPALAAVLLVAGAASCAPAGVRLRTLIAELAAPLVRLGTGVVATGRGGSRLLRAVSQPPATSVFVALVIAVLLALSWTRGAYIAG